MSDEILSLPAFQSPSDRTGIRPKAARRKISGGNQHPPEYQMPAQSPGLELGIPHEWKEIPEQSKILHYPNTPDFR